MRLKQGMLQKLPRLVLGVGGSAMTIAGCAPKPAPTAPILAPPTATKAVAPQPPPTAEAKAPESDPSEAVEAYVRKVQQIETQRQQLHISAAKASADSLQQLLTMPLNNASPLEGQRKLAEQTNQSWSQLGEEFQKATCPPPCSRLQSAYASLIAYDVNRSRDEQQMIQNFVAAMAQGEAAAQGQLQALQARSGPEKQQADLAEYQRLASGAQQEIVNLSKQFPKANPASFAVTIQ